MRVDYSMFEGYRGEGQCAHRALARRSDRRWRPVAGQAGTRQLSEARGARRRLEVNASDHDPTLYNEDLAPVPPEKRTWGIYNYASLWVAMAVCIPTYMLASAA